MSDNLAQRITRLRAERQMTLEQVADIVGEGKSTVKKWESGKIANMRRDKIASLAKALGTTPEHLMGWGIDNTPEEPELSEGERDLIELFRRVDPSAQQMVLQMIRSALLSMQKEP